MMPVIKGVSYTKTQIVLYSFLLLAVSWLPFATGFLGVFYLAVSSFPEDFNLPSITLRW